MPVKHSTNVVVADDGTSPVGSDEWNADHIESYSPGSFAVATESFVIMSNHLKLTSTQRVTLEGTARLAMVT